MANETQINSELANISTTVINHSVQQNSNVTVLNTDMAYGSSIKAGQILCGKYVVIKKMDIVTGEADLYLCEYNREQYVAKLYRRKVAIKSEIARKLMGIDSPFVARIYETGEVNGFPMEILPYYKYGSLQGRTFDYQQLKEYIIPSLNEGLKVLHDNGILHKDLKPSNIMVADNHKDVAIIDFGISSVREDNNTVIVTKTGMTPEYSAPETFRSLFLEESDYYSLGITLYELFCGYTPYNSMTPEAIEQYSLVQRIPFPENMPADLQDLIAACTYYDITNRKNKANPNRRWTYEEVKKWCNGNKQVIPGEGIGNAKIGDINPYKFMGETYVEVAKLTKALAVSWNEGKKQLFRGILSGFFKTCNPELAGYCIDAEEEATRINGRDDMIFWKLLYKLNQNTTDFYWKGHVYQGLPALGREILDKLWKDDAANDTYYYDILNERMLSNYVSIKAAENKGLADAVKGLEDAYQIAETQRVKKKNLYLMAYMLSGQKLMHMEGKEFRTVGEFADYLKGLLDESYDKFEAVCHKLIDYDDNLDVQFESWLLALGKKQELNAWRKGLKE
jgi:predicted Ser/Thr protein kinase